MPTHPNSGGRVANFQCQVKFAPNSKNFRKFTTVCPALPKLSLIILDPAETSKQKIWYNCPKKYLTSSSYYCIIGAAKDLAFGIFAQKGQKVLDKLESLLYYMAPPRRRLTLLGYFTLKFICTIAENNR